MELSKGHTWWTGRRGTVACSAQVSQGGHARSASCQEQSGMRTSWWVMAPRACRTWLSSRWRLWMAASSGAFRKVICGGASSCLSACHKRSGSQEDAAARQAHRHGQSGYAAHHRLHSAGTVGQPPAVRLGLRHGGGDTGCSGETWSAADAGCQLQLTASSSAACPVGAPDATGSSWATCCSIPASSWPYISTVNAERICAGLSLIGGPGPNCSSCMAHAGSQPAGVQGCGPVRTVGAPRHLQPVQRAMLLRRLHVTLLLRGLSCAVLRLCCTTWAGRTSVAAGL